MVVAVAKDWPSVFVVSSVWWWFDGEDLEIEMRDEGVVVEKEKRLERLSITDVEEITLGMFFATVDPWSVGVLVWSVMGLEEAILKSSTAAVGFSSSFLGVVLVVEQAGDVSSPPREQPVPPQTATKYPKVF